MKTLITFLLILISHHAFSQEQEHKYSIGGFAAAGSTLFFSDPGNAQEKFSWSAGFSASRTLSKLVDFDTGLTFSDRSQLLKNVTYASNLNVQTGDFDTTFRILDRKQFIEIPLTFTLHTPYSKRWGIRLTGGMCVGYVIKELKTWEATPLGERAIPDYRQIVNTERTTCFRLIGGIGFERSFENNVVLSFSTDYSFYYLPDSYKMLSDKKLIVGELRIGLVKRF